MFYFIKDYKEVFITFILASIALSFATKAFIDVSALKVWVTLAMKPLAISLIFLKFREIATKREYTLRIAVLSYLICFALFLIGMIIL